MQQGWKNFIRFNRYIYFTVFQLVYELFSPSYKRENNFDGSERCLLLIFSKFAEYVEISRYLKTRLRPQQQAAGHLAVPHPRSRSISDLSITGQSCQQLAVIVNQAEA